MKLLLLLAVLLGNRSAQTSTTQTEVVLGALASTSIPIPTGTRSVEIFNNGIWTIWCNPAGPAVMGSSRSVQAGGSWVLDASPTALAALQCIALVGQTSGAATIITTLQ